MPGYESKKLSAALQSIMLDKKDSDCGTQTYLTVELNDDNISQFIYRCVVEGSKLTLITAENINSFKNKVVKIRSPLYCLTDKLSAIILFS